MTTTNEDQPDATVHASLDMTIMHRMAELQLRKRDLKADLREVEAEIANLQQPCLDAMIEANVLNLPLRTPSGRITLYMHHQLYARPIGGADGRAAVLEALRAEGMDEFIKTDCNLNQLSAFARECQRGEEQMPARLAAVLELNNSTEIRSRVS